MYHGRVQWQSLLHKIEHSNFRKCGEYLHQISKYCAVNKASLHATVSLTLH
jgi:hypothetical protein